MQDKSATAFRLKYCRTVFVTAVNGVSMFGKSSMSYTMGYLKAHSRAKFQNNISYLENFRYKQNFNDKVAQYQQFFKEGITVHTDMINNHHQKRKYPKSKRDVKKCEKINNEKNNA